jgi:hypothetical protein
VQRHDETTDSKLDYYSPSNKRRTALIVVAVVAGLVLVGALHLLGANPHGG